MTNDKPFVNVSGHLRIASGIFEVPDGVQARIDGNVPGGLIDVGLDGTLNILGQNASQTLRHACVEEKGFLFASGALASVHDVYVNAGGSLFVISGATVWEVETEGMVRIVDAGHPTGHLRVRSGGILHVTGSWVDKVTVCGGGSAHIMSGAHIEQIEVCPNAACRVYSGSVASAQIDSGGTMSLVNGMATEVFQQSGGVLLKEGRCKLHYQSISEVGGVEWKDYGSGSHSEEEEEANGIPL